MDASEGPPISDKDGLEFARTYTPARAPESYDWVLKHGRDQIELCHRLLDVIEGKADSLMRYVGAVALAVSVGAPVVSPASAKLWVLYCLSPSFVLFAAAAVCCMVAVRPRRTPALPTIQKAFQYAEFFDRDAVTRFYATMVPLEKELADMIKSKGRAVLASWICFWLAMVYLPFGVFRSL